MPTLKLRQDTVKTLPYEGPGGKQYCVYWDNALACFGLRVHPGGRRVYVCSYRVNQRKRLATLLLTGLRSEVGRCRLGHGNLVHWADQKR